MFRVPPLPRNLAACERDLGHDDPAVRLSVLLDLPRGRSLTEAPRRAELCLVALSDPSSQVRKRALLSLADLAQDTGRDRGMSERVLALLSDVDLGVRQMAVLCLGEISPPDDQAVKGRLELLLKASAPAIRYQALLSLCQVSGRAAGPDVLLMLKDEDHDVRELSVRLLDEVILSDEPLSVETVDALTRATSDESPFVRLVAELVLGERGIVASREMIAKVVRREMRVREPRDEQTAVLLAGRLQMQELTSALRRRAFGLLGYSLDPFRWGALASLARLFEERAMQKLVRSLHSRRYLERTMAAKSLGESGRAEAGPLLVALDRKQDLVDQSVVSEALQLLERFPARSG